MGLILKFPNLLDKGEPKTLRVYYSFSRFLDFVEPRDCTEIIMFIYLLFSFYLSVLYRTCVKVKISNSLDIHF